MSIFIVDHFLVKRLPKTLSDAALHLSIDEQGVNHFAAVVHRDIFFDLHVARLGLDFDDANVRAERKSKIGRFKRRLRGQTCCRSLG